MEWLLIELTGWPMLAISALFGLLVGSFINVVIYRTPIILQTKWRADCCEFMQLDNSDNGGDSMSLAWPGSRCPNCNSAIRPWQNIPLLSYLLLRGQCANCGSAIGLRYPLVELITAVITVLVVLEYGLSWVGLGGLLLSWSLIALTGIDLDTQLLPDTICLPLLWLGLIANSFGVYVDLYSALWGAVSGYMSLWSVFWLFKLVTGKDGMGFGDFKLTAALGAWMGWQALPMIILIASISGLVAAVLMVLLLRHDRRMPIAFGPYLAVGGWLSFMYAAEISAAMPFLFPF